MTSRPSVKERRKPKLILLTQWFDPEPTFKGALFAKALTLRGYDVEVVTGFPNYPGGKLYPGYNLRPIKRELHDDFKVTRVFLYPSHGHSALGRALNYFSFMAAAFFYIAFVAKRADVIYCYHPPMTSGLAAALAGAVRRTPFVIDIQDMWPETLAATGMMGSKKLLGLIAGLCDFVYRRASHIVVLSPGFAKSLRQKGAPDVKISVIYNWADAASVVASPPSQDRTPDGQFEILFAGNMGKAQGLDVVLDAAKVVAKQGSGVRFALLGDGVETDRLKRRTSDEAITNVRFLPRVPMSEVGAFLQAADALLVCLRDDPLFRITVPSKTQAYMAAGRPVVMCVSGDAADLISAAGCGVVCPPDDAEALARAAMTLAAKDRSELSRMGKAGRDYYERCLSIEAGADAFARIFASVLKCDKARAS